MDLFGPPMRSAAAATRKSQHAPLADRLRPTTLAEVVGQEQLLGEGRLLAGAIASDRLPSIIFWGPPGSGKTTLARVIAQATQAHFIPLSAVLSGVPDLRRAVQEAEQQRKRYGRATILFVDEIHRFNKAQQDALLPHVENGTVTLIGATTENPSFAVVAALLSRVRVFELQPLSEQAVVALLQRALVDGEKGLGKLALGAENTVLTAIAAHCQGDARRALDVLEVAAQHAVRNKQHALDLATVQEALAAQTLVHDKTGEGHYNVVSAFIKSMRGSDPDAALYWMFRMLEGGEDPLFVLRRMLIFASEDIGNADPQALSVAVAADAAFQRLGMPEGNYVLGHCCVYLACAPKSNACTVAWKAAQVAVQQHGALPVPHKLRNPVTRHMKEWGYGKGYRYPHSEGGYVTGETYLPEKLVGEQYYVPTNIGAEERVAEQLAALRERKEAAGVDKG